MTEALADQVCLPFADLMGERPPLAGLLGLPAGAAAGNDMRDRLRASVRAGFDAAARLDDPDARRGAMLDALLLFVEDRLDGLDAEASGGFRSGRPSLLLLIDQLEEVFRPEVGAHAGRGRADLLDLIVDAHARLQGRSDSGLFIALAMRSEELHRCTEHPDLAEVVNASAYLLELLDPRRGRDREELRRAVVEPVRRVFRDWGLPLDARANSDEPFAPGVVDWLIEGVVALSPALEHQPDRLPLLQHALQAMWHAAMKDWSRPGVAEAGAGPLRLRIEKRHLPGQAPGAAEGVPDLAATLDARADDARDEAVALFATAVLGAARHADGRLRRRDELEPGQQKAGDAAVCAAFRALARRDDRGNWARRFAGTAEMAELLRADPAVRDGRPPIAAAAMENGLGLAMAGFTGRGFVEARKDCYDISHEALIRNWQLFQAWLRDPDTAAQALARAVADLDLAATSELRGGRLRDKVPALLSEQLAPLLDPRRATLPESWAVQHLEPLLERPTVRDRWKGLAAPGADTRGLASAVLGEIGRIRRRADRSRLWDRAWKWGALAGLALVLGGAFFYARIASDEARLEAARGFAEERSRLAEASLDTVHGLVGLVFDLAQRLRNQQGVTAEAVRRILDGAMALLDRQGERVSGNPRLLVLRAAALREFAETYASLGDTGRQLAAAREAREIAQRLAEGEPADAERQHELGLSHRKVGEALLARGDPTAALAAFRAELTLREQWAARDPENARWQNELALSHQKVCNALIAQRNRAGALSACASGHGVAEALAARDRDNTQWQHTLAEGHGWIAEALYMQGEGAAALAAFRASLAILQRLAEREPGNTQWQSDLSAGHSSAGGILSGRGDTAGAMAAYRAGSCDPRAPWPLGIRRTRSGSASSRRATPK